MRSLHMLRETAVMAVAPEQVLVTEAVLVQALVMAVAPERVPVMAQVPEREPEHLRLVVT